MSTRSLVALDIANDATELVTFLTNEVWPFHVNSKIEKTQAESWIAQGQFQNENCATFWIVDENTKAGFIRIFDLEDIGDGYPMFDIRVSSRFRGRGLGRFALDALLMFLFNKYPELDRVAGTTRADNVAMRRLFRSMGFVKEGHYRKDWPGQDGVTYDTVKYAILREDWETGTKTPVHWNDE